MAQPIALVVFDIAGTTVEDNGEIAVAFQDALKHFGYKVPVEKINPIKGYKKTEAIQRLVNEYEQNKDLVSEAYIREIHGQFLQRITAFYSNAEKLRPLPFAEEVFASLKARKVAVGLDTGFSKETTDIIMNRLGWVAEGKVDYVISSDEVPAGRPHPYMIQELMRRSQITDAQQVIKVGDTEADINEGKMAGCRYSIGITTGAFTAEALAVYEPSFIINDLRELITIIDNLQ